MLKGNPWTFSHLSKRQRASRARQLAGNYRGLIDRRCLLWSGFLAKRGFEICKSVKISVCCFSSSDSRWVEGGMLCSLAKRSRRSSDYSSITRHVVSIQTMRFPWEHFDMQLSYMLVPPWKISWWNVFRGMLKKWATSGNWKEEWRFFCVFASQSVWSSSQCQYCIDGFLSQQRMISPNGRQHSCLRVSWFVHFGIFSRHRVQNNREKCSCSKNW